MSALYLCIAFVAVFFLPLKFGAITGVPEIPFLPYDLISWIIFTYPPISFPIFASLLCLVSILILPRPRSFSFRMAMLCVWSFLCLVSFIGIFNASVKDFPILQVCHLSGVALFMIAMFYALENIPEAENWISFAILASLLFLFAAGVQQYFWGFKESLEYVYQQEASSGVKLADGVRNRLEQTRLFTTFSLCNSYAAHLVLVAPFCIYLICASATAVKFTLVFVITCMVYFIFPYTNQAMFFLISLFYSLSLVLIWKRFPERLLPHFRYFCVLTFSLSFLFNLYFTGSRAAVLAFGGSIGLVASAVLYAKFASRRKALIVLALIAVATIVLYAAIVSGRDLGSMHVRLDYYRVALRIFFQNPLIGTGWGDFFHEYPRMKNFPGTEAPHTPHNFVLSFASQAGIIGLVAALAVLLVPLCIFLWKTVVKKEVNMRNSAIMTGYLAWCLHGLLDINIQIAGTVATAVTLLMMMRVDLPSARKFCDARICGRKAFGLLWHQCILVFLAFGLFIAAFRFRAEASFQKLHDLCEARFASEEKFAQISPATVERLLKASVSEMPYSPFPWASAGAFFQRRGIWTLAETCYANAVRLSPQRASYYYRLAQTQFKLGKKDEAIQNLKTAAEMFPNAEYRDILKKVLDEKKLKP